ncbi:MAG: hypothetical protein ABH829_05720 [archaeon]
MNPAYIISLLINAGLIYVGYQTYLGAMSPAYAGGVLVTIGVLALIASVLKLLTG